MANELRFDNEVVIITGAGGGLGRSHALLFAGRGAKVVVNDLGGAATGGGRSSAAADAVVQEIKDLGGEAVANYDSVEDGDKIVQTALDHFGRIDVVVNNAGILRDVSFHKMSAEDWDLIYRVHVLGSFRVTQAAWPHLRDQEYGRVIMTASAAGIYGNFGQANYSTAKLGLVGFANTLALEGRKRNIHVNTIAPVAGSRLTETILPQEITDALKPELVSPLVAWLCHRECEETGGLFELGGGFFAKLRWERTRGKMYRLGRTITPENLRGAWEEITDFSSSEHPANVTESMQPVLGNIQAGESKGGNEFIDVDEALAYEFPDFHTSYDERDLALYALGVGAGADPLDDGELQLVYEMHGSGMKPLPTYGVIPVINAVLAMAKEGKKTPGLNYGFDRILHGEQYTELKRPLPPKATLTHKLKIKDIWDKGKGAVVVTEAKSYDESGDLLVINELTTFVRGAGGWGGERGPSSDANQPPERDPDAVVTEKIGANQSLLYRLSGDWNPLHVDPNFAGAFGFERPILHGLCTFGYAGRHVIKSFAPGGDPRYFKSIKVRFADSVYPGETLVTEMWKESDQRIILRCKVVERDSVVISNASIELYPEIPVKKEIPKKVDAPTTAERAEPTSADVFRAIGTYVEQHPDLVGRVATVYQFKLTNPDAIWTVDAKNGPGAVTEGPTAVPDCTLEISDADFMDMCTGKADPQKLYFGGKLKISGNVMASQKLDFLKQVEPQLVHAAMESRLGGAAASAGDSGTGGEVAQEPSSADIFAAIGAYVTQHPELVGQVGTVYLWNLTSPQSAWTLDLKSGEGLVAEGAVESPDCTLELAESDFMDMVSGKADPQKLYFGGKLKISGNVMASQKLEFLQKIDPQAVKAALAESGRKAAPAQQARAAAPATKAAGAPAVFERLGRLLTENPGLASEVGSLVLFRVTDPEADWLVDLRQAPGVVKPGVAEAAAVLTLSDEDLCKWTAGKAEAQALFQQGKLRVDGDIGVAQRLQFMTRLG